MSCKVIQTGAEEKVLFEGEVAEGLWFIQGKVEKEGWEYAGLRDDFHPRLVSEDGMLGMEMVAVSDDA